jgi:hypothetical protein
MSGPSGTKAASWAIMASIPTLSLTSSIPDAALATVTGALRLPLIQLAKWKWPVSQTQAYANYGAAKLEAGETKGYLYFLRNGRVPSASAEEIDAVALRHEGFVGDASKWWSRARMGFFRRGFEQD